MKSFWIVLIALTSLSAFANSNMEEKKQKMEERTDEATADMGRGIRRTSREVKDKTCELVNGKMECAARKVKHSIQNGVDKAEDAVD